MGEVSSSDCYQRESALKPCGVKPIWQPGVSGPISRVPGEMRHDQIYSVEVNITSFISVCVCYTLSHMKKVKITPSIALCGGGFFIGPDGFNVVIVCGVWL